MTKEQALDIWESIYGDNDIAYDFASHQIRKEDYQDEMTGQGWDVDLIQPLNRGGYNGKGNYVIEAIVTKAVRNGRASFKVGNFSYEVRKGRRYGTYSIFDVTDRNHIINMDPSEENQEYTYNEARMSKSVERQMEEKAASFLDPMSFYHQPKADVKEETPIVFDDSSVKEEVPSENENEAKEEITPEPEVVLDEDNLNQNEEKETSIYDLMLNETEEPVVEEQVEEKEDTPVVLEEETVIEENQPVEKEEEDTVIVEEESLESNHEENSNESFDEQIEQLIEENDRLKQELESERKEKEDIVLEKENIIHEKEERIVVLSSDISHLQEEKDKIQSDYEILKEESAKNDELQEKMMLLSQKEEENIEIHHQLDEKENEISRIQSEKDKLELDIQELNLKLQDLSNSEASLKTQISEKEMMETVYAANEEKSNASLKEKEDEIALLQSQLNEKELAHSQDLENLRKENEEDKKILLSKQNEQEENCLKIKKDRDSILLRYAVLEDRTKTLNEEISRLQETVDSLQNSKDSDKAFVEAEKSQNEALMNSIQDIKAQKESLVQSLNEKDALIEELKKEKDDISTQLTLAFSEKENLKNDAQLDEIEKANLTSENQKIKLEINALHDQRNQLMLENSQLKKGVEDSEKELKEAKEHLLYLSVGGNEAFYSEFQSALGMKEATEEVILQLLREHPNWIFDGSNDIIPLPAPLVEEESEIPSDKPSVEEYSTLDLTELEKEQERSTIGKKMFAQFYLDSVEAIDFAGRTIRLDAYQDEKSKYAWDYLVLNKNLPASKDNVIIGNLASLHDISLRSPFNSNGHRYQIVEENGKQKLLSLDDIIDVYDYNETMNVVSHATDVKAPLVYVFVKFFPYGTERQPDYYQMQKFINIMEKTVKKICIHSYIAMQTSSTYAFATFDGNVDTVYEEVKKYTILLNSYRYCFQKEKWLNCIIVCSEVQTELSNRFYSFERIASITQDKEMGAINYDLNKTSVVDTLIRRTVHFGPSIVDKLHFKPEYLSDSRLGQGNYAQAYSFDKMFKQTVVTFNVNYQKKD